MESTNLRHELLGSLGYESELGWYRGDVPYNGRTINLSIEAADPVEEATALARAAAIFQDLERYADAAHEYAAMALAESEEIAVETLREKLTLAGLVVRPTEEVAFFFGDGDLFDGQTIEVQLNAGDEFEYADFAE